MAQANENSVALAAEKAYATAATEVKEVAADVKAAVATATTTAKPAVKKTAAKKKPAAKKAPAKKVTAKKTAAKSTRKTAAKKVKKAPAKKAVAKKTAAKRNTKKTDTFSKIKETIMATDKNIDFSETVKNTLEEIQTRAKSAYGKSTDFAGDLTEMNKDNLEALRESGKILAEGLQDLGKGYVEDAKAAYGTVSEDARDFVSIKSPSELFELQGKVTRRNFDAAVEFGTKNSEKLVKLANDAFAPISGRISATTEKFTKAA